MVQTGIRFVAEFDQILSRLFSIESPASTIAPKPTQPSISFIQIPKISLQVFVDYFPHPNLI
jgi:hypothetical protein